MHSQSQKSGLTRLPPDAAIAAQNRRLHALSGCLVAKAHSRTRRAGEANRWAARYHIFAWPALDQFFRAIQRATGDGSHYAGRAYNKNGQQTQSSEESEVYHDPDNRS